MQPASQQKYYKITVVLAGGKTRDVNVKAASREVAERRAMKRVDGVRIQRDS